MSVGIPVGFSDAVLRSDDDLRGWGALYAVGLAVVLECLALFTLGLVYPSGQVVPPWIPFLDVHPAKLRTTQQRLNNRPMPLRSGVTPQEAYAAEINMQ